MKGSAVVILPDGPCKVIGPWLLKCILKRQPLASENSIDQVLGECRQGRRARNYLLTTLNFM